MGRKRTFPEDRLLAHLHLMLKTGIHSHNNNQHTRRETEAVAAHQHSKRRMCGGPGFVSMISVPTTASKLDLFLHRDSFASLAAKAPDVINSFAARLPSFPNPASIRTGTPVVESSILDRMA